MTEPESRDEQSSRANAPEHSGRPDPVARRRARTFLPAVYAGVLLFVIAFMVLVSQCGRSAVEDESMGGGPSVTVPAVAPSSAG